MWNLGFALYLFCIFGKKAHSESTGGLRIKVQNLLLFATANWGDFAEQIQSGLKWATHFEINQLAGLLVI